MIRFEIGGRTVDPRNIGDALMAAALESIKAQIQEKVGTIRDPNTGEFPTVVVRGSDLNNLRMSVEGSDELIALVRERLGLNSADDDDAKELAEAPRVFLSYASEDHDLAKRLAESLQARGIDTWWDRWGIRAGDSLRQKIDEGLSGCTHFLVLLTPRSIGKPWVNQEMDAGLVRKLKDECRFLPVRHELPASALPPLLSGMLSPEVAGDEDITQLISDIYEVSRKPPLGVAPDIVAQAVDARTGYSPAATAIARLFVERTRSGMFADPQLDVEGVAEAAGLSVPDTKDGLFELSGFFNISFDHVMVQASLFTEFDRHWKPWNPAEDALRLAADIANDPDFPADCGEIAGHYGWEPRRLNPAISYLFDRGMLIDYRAMNTSPFVMIRVVGKIDPIRRFVKSRN